MSLQIRDLTIDPPLALAPMVGLSHSALRMLLIELGGVGLLYTEMLSAKRLPFENERRSPYLMRDKTEKPLIYQIYATEQCDLDRTVERLEQLAAEGIDINLGCPAPKLRKLGAGQFLFERRGAVEAIVRRLRRKTELPLSAKIRIGEQPDPVRLTELCRLLEHEGIDVIVVHARLFDEKFCRKPRWELLEPVKKAVSIPLLANGGIFSVDDARRCLERSGADGLMIGRGAAWRPWIFRDIAEQIYGGSYDGERPAREEIYLRFVSLLQRQFSPERRLGRLKQFTHYFAATYTYGHQLAARVQASGSLEEATERARTFFKEAAA